MGISEHSIPDSAKLESMIERYLYSTQELDFHSVVLYTKVAASSSYLYH